MSIQLSPVAASRVGRCQRGLSVKSIELSPFPEQGSPLVGLDEFRSSGAPSGPNPRAGFSAVTYVLEDSSGALRSRDSLGNDIVMGPGGIVWNQAGSGLIHEERPAERQRELHGLHVFINLSSRNKLVAPRVFFLARSQMQEWHGRGGDRVRVVVGSFRGVSSPLVPAEPFHWLDVELRQQIKFDLPEGHCALVYVLSGALEVRVCDGTRNLESEQAVALYGSGGSATFVPSRPARFLILSGKQIREPMVVEGGSFMMNERSQLDAAIARYQAGAMGQLAPLPGA